MTCRVLLNVYNQNKARIKEKEVNTGQTNKTLPTVAQFLGSEPVVSQEPNCLKRGPNSQEQGPWNTMASNTGRILSHFQRSLWLFSWVIVYWRKNPQTFQGLSDRGSQLIPTFGAPKHCHAPLPTVRYRDMGTR